MKFACAVICVSKRLARTTRMRNGCHSRRLSMHRESPRCDMVSSVENSENQVSRARTYVVEERAQIVLIRTAIYSLEATKCRGGKHLGKFPSILHEFSQASLSLCIFREIWGIRSAYYLLIISQRLCETSSDKRAAKKTVVSTELFCRNPNALKTKPTEVTAI